MVRTHGKADRTRVSRARVGRERVGRLAACAYTGRIRSMSPKRSGWAGYGKYWSAVMRSKSHPRSRKHAPKSKGEPFDLFAEARLRYWLRGDKMLPEQYRSTEKLREAIFRWCAQVCD